MVFSGPNPDAESSCAPGFFQKREKQQNKKNKKQETRNNRQETTNNKQETRNNKQQTTKMVKQRNTNKNWLEKKRWRNKTPEKKHLV